MTIRPLLLCVALPGVLALTGCGSEPEQTASPSKAPTSADPALPACDTIWAAGKTLPSAYQGCAGTDGAKVAVQETRCSSGQVIYRYSDRFYAVADGPVVEAPKPLKEDPKFQKVFAACRG